MSQLDGLYGRSLAWPKFDPEFKLNTILNDDFILHLTNKNCNRFAQIQAAVESNKETVEMYAQIDADLEQTLFTELRILAEMPDATTHNMHNVCNYIYWANTNHVELKFDMTQDQIDQCNVSN